MGDPASPVRDFLAQRRLAVAGVSRDPKQADNLIYRTLRGRGYQVVALNPGATEVEGDPAYPNLAAVPVPVDGVVVVTHPNDADAVVRDCAATGVRRVWFHRSFGTGSISDSAVRFCEERGITAIEGACPMMFVEPVDLAHRCMRWILRVGGRLPT